MLRFLSIVAVLCSFACQKQNNSKTKSDDGLFGECGPLEFAGFGGSSEDIMDFGKIPSVCHEGKVYLVPAAQILPEVKPVLSYNKELYQRYVALEDALIATLDDGNNNRLVAELKALGVESTPERAPLVFQALRKSLEVNVVYPFEFAAQASARAVDLWQRYNQEVREENRKEVVADGLTVVAIKSESFHDKQFNYTIEGGERVAFGTLKTQVSADMLASMARYQNCIPQINEVTVTVSTADGMTADAKFGLEWALSNLNGNPEVVARCD